MVRARDVIRDRELTIRAKVLVNACGPYVDDHNARTGVTTSHHHVFSKGIHLIVPRLTQEKRVLTFFADDGRLFFVIPMGPRTCIGTTDTKVDSPITRVTAEDRAFVLSNINKRLRLPRPWQPVLGYLDLERKIAETGNATPDARTVFDWVCAIRREIGRAHV